ncbi:MAG TPA: Minf_1886 family protein [Tepidisphaeraceae bacterium]|jgi:uncharacterized repeat protein (TIGR04138 family)
MPPSPSEKHPPAQPTSHPGSKTIQQIVDELGRYPLEAFGFVQEGLSFTVDQQFRGGQFKNDDPHAPHHITGQQLCEGLRELALVRWGLMARAVLRRWGITSTVDFGRIVFAMVDNGLMSKTEQDSVEDFRDVYDFAGAFDAGRYRIPPEPAATGKADKGRV